MSRLLPERHLHVTDKLERVPIEWFGGLDGSHVGEGSDHPVGCMARAWGGPAGAGLGSGWSGLGVGHKLLVCNDESGLAEVGAQLDTVGCFGMGPDHLHHGGPIGKLFERPGSLG